MTALACYAFFLALGALVSYEDWTRKKIRNRLVVLGLLACAAALAWLAANSLLGRFHLRFWGAGEYYLPGRYYSRMLLHMSLSFAASFALWRYSIWPAGDAKFFTLCAFFVPLIDPNLPGFPELLFVLILVNVFVPAGVVFAVESVGVAASRLPALRRVDWPVWRKAQLDKASVRLRELWPQRWEYLVLAVNLFAAFFALQTAQRRFAQASHIPWMQLVVFMAMCASWRVLVAVLRNKAVGLLTFAGVAAWTGHGVAAEGWGVARHLGDALRMTLSFGMFLSFGRILFYWFIEKESLRELRPESLAQGSVLSDTTWERLGAQKELSGKLERRCVDGLTDAESAAVKSWLTGRAENDYTVYHTIPFALWIFLGALLTLTRRNSVSLLAHDWAWLYSLIKSAAAGHPS